MCVCLCVCVCVCGLPAFCSSAHALWMCLPVTAKRPAARYREEGVVFSYKGMIHCKIFKNVRQKAGACARGLMCFDSC